MDDHEKKKPLYERINDVNILGDGSLFNIKPSDLVIKSFEEDSAQIDEEEY